MQAPLAQQCLFLSELLNNRLGGLRKTEHVTEFATCQDFAAKDAEQAALAARPSCFCASLQDEGKEGNNQKGGQE